MKKSRLLFFVVLIMAACTPSNQVYNDFITDFPEHKWMQSNALNYQFIIHDTVSAHALVLDFRHVYGFPYANLNLQMELILPSGEKEQRTYAVPVINEDKTYCSECAGDYCDLSYVLEEGFVFPRAGVYSVTLSYADDLAFLNAVMGVGLIVEKLP